MPRSKTQTFLLLLIVLCAWSGILLRFGTSVLVRIQNGMAVSQSLTRFFSCFTILTNLLIAITSALSLFFPGTGISQMCSRPGIITAVAVYIIVAGAVYNLALRLLYHPQGWARFFPQMIADKTSRR